MERQTTRRRFLARTSRTGLGFLGGGLGFLSALPPVRRAEARLPPEKVELRPEIEPLVRLLEDTPRERLLEEVAGRLRRGLAYPEIVAALLLAGVRNVQPRPQVGFKFHAVLVVNSAHLASLSSPPRDRWLPIFWTLDYFKSAQARDASEGDWSLGPVREAALPSAAEAPARFLDAMERWDPEGADAAVAALARSRGASEVFELLWRLGARDFRSIGHKAIFVANSWRTLQMIGWQHAEPVLRSLAYALLQHEGGNPAKRDAEADRPYRKNRELASEFPAGWLAGRRSDAAVHEVLEAARNASPEASAARLVELLQRGAAAEGLWDGIFAAAAELLLRQPGIIALHAMTTANALHFAFSTSGDDTTRRLLLLQAASFMAFFREAAKGRGALPETRVEQIAGESKEPGEAPGLDEVFEAAGRDRREAVRKAHAYLGATGDARTLIQAARRLVFLKGDDPHDYKFSSAVLEDYYHIAPAWRDRVLAASLTLLPGSGQPDNPLVERTRAALEGGEL